MASRQRGISLIEPMIAIAVLAILLAMAVPAASDFLKNQRIRTAAEALQNGLQMARAEAVRRNTNVQFVLGTGTTWSVQLASDSSELQARTGEEGTAGVILTTAPAAATTVTFDGLGRRAAANADASLVLTRISVDLDSAVLAAADTRDLRIDIKLGGEVRMCDPNPTVNSTDSRYCS